MPFYINAIKDYHYTQGKKKIFQISILGENEEWKFIG